MRRSYDRIDELLRALPEAPAELVARAREIPQMHRALALLSDHDGADADAVGAALREVGLEPDEGRRRTLRRLQERRRASGGPGRAG